FSNDTTWDARVREGRRGRRAMGGRKFALRLPKAVAGLYRVPCPHFLLAVIAMPFLLLLCLSLACLPVTWPAPHLARSPEESLVGVLAAAGVLFAYVATVTWRTRRRLRTWPEQRERWLSDYGRARTRFALLAMALFVLVLYGYGWGWAVQGVVRGWVGESPLPPGTELLILAPLPLSLTLSWAVFYDAERAVAGSRPFGGRWGYVGLQV